MLCNSQFSYFLHDHIAIYQPSWVEMIQHPIIQKVSLIPVNNLDRPWNLHFWPTQKYTFSLFLRHFPYATCKAGQNTLDTKNSAIGGSLMVGLCSMAVLLSVCKLISASLCTSKHDRRFAIDKRITSQAFCELAIWRVTHDLLTHMWRWACPGPFSSFLYHHIWVCGSSASFHISSLPGAFLNVLRARQGTKLHEVKMYSAQKK